MSKISVIKRTKTNQQYLKELNRVHGNQYKPLEQYVNAYTPILHLCTKCEKHWKVQPLSILRGSGCPKCGASSKREKQTKTHQQYLRDLERRCGKRYIPLEEYVNAKTPIWHLDTQCKMKWKVKPNSLQNGKGCPVCKSPRRISKMACDWLKYEAGKRNIRINHAMNGGEYKIPRTRMQVDGFHRPSNTIFEFYGDDWHGNPKKWKPRQKCHPFVDKTAGKLYKETKRREKSLKKLGYKIISIWEGDWKKRKQFYTEFKDANTNETK